VVAAELLIHGGFLSELGDYRQVETKQAGTRVLNKASRRRIR